MESGEVEPKKGQVTTREASEAEITTEEVILRRRVVEWVAERDSSIAGALEEMSTRRPDMFATEQEQLAFVVELARLQGKQEALAEASIALAGLKNQQGQIPQPQ